jgi:hypothetical protein
MLNNKNALISNELRGKNEDTFEALSGKLGYEKFKMRNFENY